MSTTTALPAETTIRAYLTASIHQGPEITAAIGAVYPQQQPTISPQVWPDTCLYALAVVEHSPESVLEALSAAGTPEPCPEEYGGSREQWDAAWADAWERLAATLRTAYRPGCEPPIAGNPPNIEHYLTTTD